MIKVPLEISIPVAFVVALVLLAAAYAIHRLEPDWAEPVQPYIGAIMGALAILAIWKHPTFTRQQTDSAEELETDTGLRRRETPEYEPPDLDKALERGREDGDDDRSGLNDIERLERLRRRARDQERIRDKLERELQERGDGSD